MTQFIIVKCFCAILLINTMTVSACGPGRSGGRRRIPRKTTPLVLEQHIPNVSENTLSASGPSEGKINETDSRFTKLVPNYNPDIVFKDEEGTGIDRIMTTRLKEKLDILASLVQNHWPGIKLRVIEAWDDGSQFNPDSLHYEGRAADITTSDKDNSKYGVLARLAVIAGFDWVLYESRYHVHVSVKSDKAALSRSEGCFTGDSLVYTRTGPVALSKVNVGQEILSLDSNGQFTYSEILLFLDRHPNIETLYVNLITETGKVITLTQSHLIFAYHPITNVTTSSCSSPLTSSNSSSTLTSFVQNSSHSIPPNPSPSTWTLSSSTDPSDQWTAIFASSIQPGMFISTLPISLSSNQPFSLHEVQLKAEKVVKVTQSLRKGAYAPLTRTGNLIVNQIVASCYAVVNDHALAHLSFLPVRLYHNLIESLNYIKNWLTNSSSSSLATQRFMQSSKSSITLSQPKLETNQDDRLSLNNQINGTKYNEINVNSNNLNNGIHWYPKLLYTLAKYVISNDYMYS
ncbi:desert hedgehog protein isoform X1 [Tetranychus urticae]|nr:desert hedgehog protein isoform X1 [Tetranychus urticae]